MTGGIIEKTFSPTDRLPRAHVETKEMQYLYNDGELYYFMDMDTYEQFPLNRSQVEEAMQYVKENSNVIIKFLRVLLFL